MNRRRFWWLFCLLCLCLWGGSFSLALGADVAPAIDKIVVSKEIVYTCSHRTEPALGLGVSRTGKHEAVSLHSWNLELAKEARVEKVNYTVNPSLRWGITHQYYWDTTEFARFSAVSRDSLRFQFTRLQLDPKTRLADRKRSTSCNDFTVEPLDDLAVIWSHESQFPGKILYDYLPVSENTYHLFALTNIRGTVEKVPPNKIETHATDDERNKPKWSLTVFTNTAVPDNKTAEWEWGTWKKVETVTPLFEEEFQVVARADTYYFLTKSGKVYQSKKPEKGKERATEAVWTDKEQPIVTFVQDADNERTYVFTRNKKKDAKDVYFELDAKPKPVAYNLADAKPPKDLKDPLKSALPYVQILIADGKIKAPKAKE